jgi:hypothetical protein
MRPRTGMSTATPGAAGIRRAEVRTTTRSPAVRVTPARAHQVTRTVPINPAHQAGEGRKRAADHRPSVVEAEAGDPARRVLVVGEAAVEAEAGAATAVAGVVVAAGEPDGATGLALWTAHDWAVCGNWARRNVCYAEMGSQSSPRGFSQRDRRILFGRSHCPIRNHAGLGVSRGVDDPR